MMSPTADKICINAESWLQKVGGIDPMLVLGSFRIQNDEKYHNLQLFI